MNLIFNIQDLDEDLPMPTAFTEIDVGDRFLASGYAAIMELIYFSDYRTEEE